MLLVFDPFLHATYLGLDLSRSTMDHIKHDMGIIAKAQVRARPLKELTIVCPLYLEFSPDAGKGCKRWSRNSNKLTNFIDDY